MTEEWLHNDPSEMKIAKKASWLCKLFQSYSATVEDKKNIIKILIKEFKEGKTNG